MTDLTSNRPFGPRYGTLIHISGDESSEESLQIVLLSEDKNVVLILVTREFRILEGKPSQDMNVLICLICRLSN